MTDVKYIDKAIANKGYSTKIDMTCLYSTTMNPRTMSLGCTKCV